MTATETIAALDGVQGGTGSAEDDAMMGDGQRYSSSQKTVSSGGEMDSQEEASQGNVFGVCN